MLDGEGALGFDDIVDTTVCVCSTVSEDVLTWCTFKNIRKLVSMSAKCIMEPSAPPPLSIWGEDQDRDEHRRKLYPNFPSRKSAGENPMASWKVN